MKKSLRILTVVSLLFIAASLNNAFAQPHPGYQSNGSGSGGTPIGAGAPVGSGLVILLTLAAGYGGTKVYNTQKDKEDQV